MEPPFRNNVRNYLLVVDMMCIGNTYIALAHYEMLFILDWEKMFLFLKTRKRIQLFDYF